ALFAASTAASRANSPADAIERFLRGLLEAGLITSALVEVDCKPILRVSAGADVAEAQEELVLKTLRPRSAPSACFYVAGVARKNRPFLSSMAQQLALVLDSAFLREQTKELQRQSQRRIEEVSTIYEIGQAVDSVGIERLLEIITEKAAHVMDAQACSLMRLSPQTKSLTIAASS